MRVSVLIAHNPLVFFVLGKLRYELPNAEMQMERKYRGARSRSRVCRLGHTDTRSLAPARGTGKEFCGLVIRSTHTAHSHRYTHRYTHRQPEPHAHATVNERSTHKTPFRSPSNPQHTPNPGISSAAQPVARRALRRQAPIIPPINAPPHAPASATAAAREPIHHDIHHVRPRRGAASCCSHHLALRSSRLARRI